MILSFNEREALRRNGGKVRFKEKPAPPPPAPEPAKPAPPPDFEKFTATIADAIRNTPPATVQVDVAAPEPAPKPQKWKHEFKYDRDGNLKTMISTAIT